MGEERCAESPRGMVAKVGRTDGLSSAGGRIPPRRRVHASTMTEREAPPRQGASVFLYVDRGRVGGGGKSPGGEYGTRRQTAHGITAGPGEGEGAYVLYRGDDLRLANAGRARDVFLLSAFVPGT